MTMCPMAGCPLGSSGKSLEKNGATIRERSCIPPAASAMPSRPMNKAMMPISPSDKFTAEAQVSMMPLAPWIMYGSAGLGAGAVAVGGGIAGAVVGLVVGAVGFDDAAVGLVVVAAGLAVMGGLVVGVEAGVVAVVRIVSPAFPVTMTLKIFLSFAEKEY